MKMNKRMLLLLVAVLALGLTACNKGGSGGDNIMHTHLVEEPTILDSGRGSDNASNSILMQIQEPLFRNVENENGDVELTPAGAELVDVSEDGLTYTFHLRENKWWDGEPVTAKDYEYGIKRALNPETGGEQGYLIAPIKNAKDVMTGKVDYDMLGVTAIDDKTLEIQLEHVTPYFMQLTFVRPMYPVREDIVELHGEGYGSEADKVIGCGPFKIDEWVHNSSLTLTKNPEYYDKDFVKLDGVSYRVISDENTVYTAFEAGELDSVSTNRPEWREKFEANENIRHTVIPSQTLRFMMFNTNDDLFQNQKIRLAWSKAFDREEATEVIWDGLGVPAYGWVPPQITLGSQQYRDLNKDPLKAYFDQLPDAKTLFQEGLDELGITDAPEDITVTMTFGGTNQFFKDFGEYLQDSFKKSLGINLEISLNEWPLYTDMVSRGDFQVSFQAWGAEYNDPMSMLGLHASISDALQHGWEDAEFDRLLNEAAEELDPEVRLGLIEEAEEILLEASPIVPVNYPVSNSYIYNYLKGISTNPFSAQSAKYTYIEK